MGLERQRDSGRQLAHIVMLIIAAGLLVATSGPLRPSGATSRATLIPAGQQSATATVEAELVHEGLAGTAEPFDASLDVVSASLPTAEGSPAPAVSLDTSVSVDGVDDARPDDIPAAGSCDDERCRAEYTLRFTLARPAETDVVVSWQMSVEGPEEVDGSSVSPQLTAGGDVTPDDHGVQRLPGGTIAVRLDRVGDDDASVDLVNGSGRAVALDLDGDRVAVPAGASARIPAFTGCDQPACTDHARLDNPLRGGAIVIEGPVIATAITERGPALIDAPTIRGEPVRHHEVLTAGVPGRRLRITVDADQAFSFDAEGAENNVQPAVRVRMRLATGAGEDTVVRYRPADGTEPIVLSTLAGGSRSEEVTLASEPRDPPTSFWGRLELLAGERAEVEVEVEGIAVYPDRQPSGAEVTATVESSE